MNINVLKSIFVILIILGSSHRAKSQAYFSNPFVFSSPNFDFGVTAESYFNLKDFFVGFGAGTEEVNNDWGASVNVDFRPYFKKVLVEQSPNFYNQYREKLFFLSLDLNKKFYFLKFMDKENQIGLYIEGRFGYLFGNYRGVSSSPNDKFMIVPSGGVVATVDPVSFYLGYLYFNTGSDARNNMINLGIGIHF